MHSQAKNARRGSGISCGHSIEQVDIHQLSKLINQRQKFINNLAAIQDVKKNIIEYGQEGYKNAGVAVFCAAVLMTTDIVRIGLEKNTAGNLLFKGYDKMEGAAYKLLKLFGVKRTTRDDIVAGVTNETAKSITEVTSAVQSAREGLAKVKKVLPKKYAKRLSEPEPVSLILDIGIKMAEDTALLIDAGAQGQNALEQANISAQKIQGTINKIEKQLAVVEKELHRLIELGACRTSPSATLRI